MPLPPTLPLPTGHYGRNPRLRGLHQQEGPDPPQPSDGDGGGGARAESLYGPTADFDADAVAARDAESVDASANAEEFC